jgi:hypothetical protein
MYLNVFIVNLKVFEWTYNIFMVYFQCAYNMFQCIYRMFQCISMYLDVFIDIVIGISPSRSHCNVFAMRTHIYIFFHSTQWLPSQHAIPLHFFFPFPLTRSIFHTTYEKFTYQSLLFMFIHYSTFHIPHSMLSLVVRSIVEPK